MPYSARVGSVESWRFCPRCATELEHSRRTGSSAPPAASSLTPTPSPTACALVADDGGRVLLVRRAGDPDEGTWDLPGGFLEEAEAPLDALRRELLEETGLEIEPVEFFGAWLDRYGDGPDAPTTLDLYWTGRVTGGEAVAGDDASELRWFPRNRLPPDDEIGFPNVRAVLRAWRSG